MSKYRTSQWSKSKTKNKIGHKIRQHKKFNSQNGHKRKRQKKSSKFNSTKFLKSFFFLSHAFLLLPQLFCFKIRDYLTKIVNRPLSNQLWRFCDISKVQSLFFKILKSGDIKPKSLEGLVCYFSYMKAL